MTPPLFTSAQPAPRRGTDLAALALVLLAGCSPWSAPNSAAQLSLLKPATPSPQTVTLEIFAAWAPAADRPFEEGLWDELDEQQIPESVRQELRHNGLRAGLVGGDPPNSLATLLKLQDKPQATVTQPEPIDVEFEPTVVMRMMQLRSGRRGEYQASEVYSQLPLLVHRDGQVVGGWYDSAQGVLSITPTIMSDGRVRLELLPELHHGTARQQRIHDSGIVRWGTARPKKIFHQLHIDTVLSPGQMLVLGSRPDQPASLGHYLLASGSTRGTQRKLIVIRLAHTPPSDLNDEDPLELLP